MEHKKVTRKDLEIKKGKIEVDCIVVDGRTINLTAVHHQSIEKYITHEECTECGVEFEKPFTYYKRCQTCQHKQEVEKYNALPLVEWYGNTPLCIYNDDTYFFDSDDIITYCEDHDIKPSGLMLVLCRTTNFSTIDFDQWADEVHEDWEPSSEFKQKLKEFNEFLENESTRTWWAMGKRVDVSFLDELMQDDDVLTCGYCDCEFPRSTGGTYGEYGMVCGNCLEGLS